jgi:hypothetical protein
MNDLEELGDAIQAKLAAEESRQPAERHAQEQQRIHVACRRARFDEVAARLVGQFIRPRLEKMTSFFSNAELQAGSEANRYRCRCTMRRLPEFPATVRLDIDVRPDGPIDNAILVYDLELLPVFVQFQSSHELVLSLDTIDTWKVVEWIDRRILEFVDTYLQIPQTPQYFAKPTACETLDSTEPTPDAQLLQAILPLSRTNRATA